jgi:hypothetical protein
MDFIKKHYEKILLGAVLLGLVVLAVFLPFVIAEDQQHLHDLTEQVINPRPVPLPDLDLTNEDDAFSLLQSPYTLDFESTNKLFNPVEWQKKPDGTLIKASQLGPEACTVSNITPLYLVLTLDSVETNALGTPPRYVVYIERQAAPMAALRRRTQRFVSTDDPKKDLFTLLQVVGPPENPSELVLKLTDSGETATVSRDKPFRRVDAYSADLRYDPEKKFFPARRVGSVISFNGEDYIIVAIEQDMVILSAQSNQKKTTLRYTP